MEKNKIATEYLVERSPRAIINQALGFMAQHGFSRNISLSENTVVFQRPFHQQKGSLGGASAPGLQTVKLVITGSGEYRTRLLASTSNQQLQRELDRWIEKELGGTPYRAKGTS